jgi:hypothetical protein
MFLDSQPLTGVPADRYLTPSAPLEPGRDPAPDRAALLTARPDFVALEIVPTGNVRLDIAQYPDLRAWFAPYREVSRTRNTVIFRRQSR